MARSHMLLHCPNYSFRAAGEAWEGKDPGGVRVLLASPQWEKTGVERAVDGVDVEEIRAT
jgi:hypothetical protein